MALYLDSFTTGAYEGHYLDADDERQWLGRLFAQQAATCVVACPGEQLAGFLNSADTAYDRLLPPDLQALASKPAPSIAKLEVAPAFRASGLGTRLVQLCLADTAHCLSTPDRAQPCGGARGASALSAVGLRGIRRRPYTEPHD